MKRLNIAILLFAFIISGICKGYAQEELFLSFSVSDSEQIGVLADNKIIPSGGYASDFQPNENIENSFDENLDSKYHSNWNGTTFPVTLRWDFQNAEQIDYLIYHPRNDGNNGNFEEVEVWYTLSGGEKTKYGEYDFNGSNSPSRIEFKPSLLNPASIEFIVKSGSNNFASCAEMEFYRNNPGNEEYFNLFQDKLATKLKDGITKNDIEKISNLFLQGIAMKIFENNYSLDYRVGEFEAYLNLNKLNEALIASAYNKYENPTGIHFAEGKHLIIAENIGDKSVSLLIPDYRFIYNKGSILSQKFPLKDGVNIIDVKGWDGLGYVSHFSDTPETEDNVKIHFADSQVHGYFDITKNDNNDWTAILNNATEYPVMDLVGRHCQLAFPIEDYKAYTKNKAEELVNRYDSIVTWEQRFIGLEKYNIRPKNRVLCRVNYSYFMFKDGDGASFMFDTMSYVANPDEVLKKSWGMVHEIGHIHQMKFVTWAGMGEVSVNFPNLYINHMYPSTTSTNMSRQKTKRGMNALYQTGIAHASYHVDDYNMYKLAPFAILYHYMRVERGRSDFYADLYQELRNSEENTANWNTADFEWYFIKMACDAAKLDLIPFFEAWGFLFCTDIDGREPFEVEDYGNGFYELSSAKLQELKNYINGKGYLKPGLSTIMSDKIINQMTDIDR